MATTKRTQKEIEKDCKRIKEAAKVATSLKDIERATNYLMQKLIQQCENIQQFLNGLRNN